MPDNRPIFFELGYLRDAGRNENCWYSYVSITVYEDLDGFLVSLAAEHTWIDEDGCREQNTVYVTFYDTQIDDFLTWANGREGNICWDKYDPDDDESDYDDESDDDEIDDERKKQVCSKHAGKLQYTLRKRFPFWENSQTWIVSWGTSKVRYITHTYEGEKCMLSSVLLQDSERCCMPVYRLGFLRFQRLMATKRQPLKPRKN